MLSHKHYLHFARFVCTITLLFAISSIANIFNTANTSAATYEASISTSGSITLDVSPAGNGASVTTDTINVVSTCPEGYSVYIQGPADTTLYKDGNKSNTAATKKINPSAGTKDTPRGIIGMDGNTNTSNVNTWGYSMASDTTIQSTSFIGLTNTKTLLTEKNTGTTQTGDNLSVYYGVSVDTSIETGSYTMAESSAGAGDNKITYFLTTNLNCMTYQVIFNPTSTAGGQTVSGTGTMPNQRIKEGIATPLTTNAFTAPEGYTFVGWNTKQDGTGTSYTNGQSVTDLTTAGGTITLYAQWKSDCPANTICYNDNGANSPTIMSNQTVDPGATEVTLWASNFKRPGYGFAGWSVSPDTKVDNCAFDPRFGEMCVIQHEILTVVGPNETVDISDHGLPPDEWRNIGTRGVTLYAIWVEPAKDSNGNILTFQTPNLLTVPLNTVGTLSSKPTGYVTALKDERDNQVYAVAKLADGKYWMIENLRLDNSATLTAANTNNPAINKLSASTDPTTTAWCTSYYDSACIDQSMLYTGNATNPVANMSQATDQNIYSYGNYYNWYSATAGNGTYSFGTNNSSVTGDICPTGWRLPTGDTGGEFSSLDTSMGGTGAYQSTTEASQRWRKFPNNFVYSGNVSGSTSRQGSYGSYWSSTTRDSGVAYSLGFSSSYVNPGINASRGKFYGFVARCVLGS